MPSSCRDIRAELALCLAHSDCILQHHNKPGDCLRPPLRETLPTQCQQLQKSYASCKKGWVDMRKRFRGNRPISVSQELEADASGVSYQLYSGAPAFTAVKATDGREDERAQAQREAEEAREDEKR